VVKAQQAVDQRAKSTAWRGQSRRLRHIRLEDVLFKAPHCGAAAAAREWHLAISLLKDAARASPAAPPDRAQASPDGDFSLTRLRDPRATSRTFKRCGRKLGFNTLRFHDLRGDARDFVARSRRPLRTVADRCGHDPVVLLRNYAKRTMKSDTTAADGSARRRRACSGTDDDHQQRTLGPDRVRRRFCCQAFSVRMSLID
jgi:hypothetical protein